jgi:hypothetical protein
VGVEYWPDLKVWAAKRNKRRRSDMGFRPQPTIYNLTFDGTALDGLHVRMSCCTIKENAAMLRASVRSGDNAGVTAEDLDDNDLILNLFSDHLVSWDLEDLAGQPIPTSRDGVDSQERTIIAQLINAWQIAMVNVPNPSKTESNSGGTSEEESLGLGTSSESLGN